MSKSKDYHDYVIKNGKFVGKFEEMYQNASDIPWHQDETANAVFTDIDLTILKHFQKKEGFRTICEIGCGMGYVTDRISRELADIDVTGVDISAIAVEKAQTMFPNIHFEVFDIINDEAFTHTHTHNLRRFEQQFDIVMTKECLWYVLEKLDIFWTNLERITRKFIYISQSFPEKKKFYGSDVFPNARALEQYIGKRFNISYSCIEKDARYGNRELIHIFARRK